MRGAVRDLPRLRPSVATRPADGFTLTELLVVLTISSIIMAAISSAFIVGARTEADAYTRLQESHDGQLATAYFVSDATSARYFSKTLTPPGSDCPDFGADDVALFEWMDVATTPPIKKDAFYGVAGSPTQLIRRYCEADVVQTEVILARNLNTDPTLAPAVTCPSPATSCANLPAALQLQVSETSGYTYTLRASPRSIAPVYPPAAIQALIGTGGMTLTNTILKSTGYVIVNGDAACQGYQVTANPFQVGGGSGNTCGPAGSPVTTADLLAGVSAPLPPAAFAPPPSSSSACGSPQMTYQPGKYAPSTLGPGCLASGTYYLTGSTMLSHVTSAAPGVMLYIATGDLTLDTAVLNPLQPSTSSYPLTIFMNKTYPGTIRATGSTETINGATYAWMGTVRLTNDNFHSDLGMEVNALIAVNSIVN
jgi:prepilin-type N-terminal cleavage/methylation domain-containing protein